MTVNLFDYSKGGGCGCKIEPGKLSKVLNGIAQKPDPRILIGFDARDDASVIDLGNGNLLIQTVDFFLPVVKDPYDFGRIAAANALSDIYAMGGNPISALSILGWPLEKLSLDHASEVLKGAVSVCEEAGIVISGGHSVENPEPLFGLAVCGTVSRANLKPNNSCQSGDTLYLSKPLGLGLLANALKLDALSSSGYEELVKYSTQLNAIGIELGNLSCVNAMTDVTGFGLLGHLSEMLGTHHGAVLSLKDIPVIDEARAISERMIYPNITTNNYNYVMNRAEGLNGLEFLWLCDPQTSGGLLISSSEEIDSPGLWKIGHITDSKQILIQH